jgi:hypothetical protein
LLTLTNERTHAHILYVIRPSKRSWLIRRKLLVCAGSAALSFTLISSLPQMALRPSRLAVCVVSGERIKGSYYSTPDGPVLARCYEQYRANTR